MNWLINRFVAAVVAGVGWKLGSDAYEAVKRHVKERGERKKGEGEENGGGATQTHAVDVTDPPGPGGRS